MAGATQLSEAKSVLQKGKDEFIVAQLMHEGVVCVISVSEGEEKKWHVLLPFPFAV